MIFDNEFVSYCNMFTLTLTVPQNTTTNSITAILFTTITKLQSLSWIFEISKFQQCKK